MALPMLRSRTPRSLLLLLAISTLLTLTTALTIAPTLHVPPRFVSNGLTAGRSLPLWVLSCSELTACDVAVRVVGPYPRRTSRRLTLRRKRRFAASATARATLREAGSYAVEARDRASGAHIRASPALITVHPGATHPHGSSFTVASRVTAGASVELIAFAADYDGNAVPLRARRDRFAYEVRWLPPLPLVWGTSEIRASATRAYAPWPAPPSPSGGVIGDAAPSDAEWAAATPCAAGTTRAPTRRRPFHAARFVAPTQSGRLLIRAWLLPCRLANMTLRGSATTRIVVADRLRAMSTTAAAGAAAAASRSRSSALSSAKNEVVVGTRIVERIQLRDKFGNACAFGALPSVVGACAQKPRRFGRGRVNVSASLVRTPKEGGGAVAHAHVQALANGEVELTATPLSLGRLRWDVRVGSERSSAGLGLLAPLYVVHAAVAAATSDAQLCVNTATALPPLPATAWRFVQRSHDLCCPLGVRTPIALAEIREPAVITMKLRLRDAFRNEIITPRLAAVEEQLVVVVDGKPLAHCTAVVLGNALGDEQLQGCAALWLSAANGSLFVAVRLPSRRSAAGAAAERADGAARWCGGEARRVQLLYGGAALKIQPVADASGDCSADEEAAEGEESSSDGATAAEAEEADEEEEEYAEYGLEDEDDEEEEEEEEEEAAKVRCAGYGSDEMAILVRPRWPGEV